MVFKTPESSVAFRLFFYLFFLVASNITARTSRDTFLLQGEYAKHLPILIALTAVLMYVIVRVQTLLSRGTSPVALAVASALLGAVSYVGFLPFNMSGLASVVYFMWTEALNSLLAVQFWILASAALDARTGKKLFGIIGAGGAIGGFVAGVALVPLGKRYGVNLLPIGAGALLLAAVPFALGIRPRETESHGGGARETPGSNQWNLSHPYVRVLCLLLIPATVAATLIDYQFKVVSAAAIPDGAKLTAYFGRYYALANGLTLISQVFLTSLFLTRFGLLFSLAFLPALLLLLALPVPGLAMFAGAQALPLLVALSFAGRLTDQTVKFTIYQSAFQLLWLPVPPLHKAALKMSVEGVIKNGVSGIAGLAIAASAAIFPPSGASLYNLQTLISAIVIVSLAIWLYGAFASRRGYRTYLIQSLENRMIDFSAEDVEINSPEIRETLRNALLSAGGTGGAQPAAAKEGNLAAGEEGAVAFALDILANQSLEGWEADLQMVFMRSSSLIQARILELAARHPALLDKEYILALATDPGEHRLAAQVIAARRGYPELTAILDLPSAVDDPYADMVALCCRAITGSDTAELQRHFNTRLTSSDLVERRAALQAATSFPELADLHSVLENLWHSESAIRRLALDVARNGAKQVLISEVIMNLGDAKTFGAAKAALASFNPVVVQNELESEAYFAMANADLVHGIFRYLGSTRSAESLSILLQRMPVGDPRLFATASSAVASLIQAEGRSEAHRAAIEAKIEEAAGLVFKALKLAESKNKFAGEIGLIHEWLDIAMARWIIGACRLATAGQGLTNLEARFEGRRLKGAKRGEFLELIENATRGRVKALLLAVLDSKTDAEALRRLGTLVEKPQDLVSQWFYSAGEWPAAMAVLVILGSGADANRRWKYLNSRKLPALAQEIMLRKMAARMPYWQKSLSAENLSLLQQKLRTEVNLTMYPTLEKILLLKSVGLFSDISGEDISRLIQISHEVDMPADTQVFKAGDEGHELFIILSGEIRIHKDGRNLATLKRGDFLGEMALLDNEPRSADATTMTDCKLLSIGQQDFFDVLSGRPEILRAILRLLSGRLRKAIQSEAKPQPAEV